MQVISKLLDVPSTDPDDARRRKLLNILLVGTAIGSALLLAVNFAADTAGLDSKQHIQTLYLGIILVLTCLVIIFWINRHRAGWLASLLFLLLLTGISVLVDEPGEVAGGRSLINFVIPIMMSSVLLRPGASFIMAGLSSLTITAVASSISEMPNPYAITVFFFIALVSWLTAHTLERTLKDLRTINLELDQRVIERTQDLQKEIVERVRSEEERARAEEALARQAQQLDAELDQFARVAAHDLQEPLRIVAMYVQLLERRYKGQLDQQADEYIAYVVNGAIRVRNLLDDLITLTRVTTRGKPFAPTDCSAIVNHVLANLGIALERCDAAVTCGDLPTVMADKAQLTQVFQNLVVNAIQFRGDSPLELYIGAEQTDGAWVFSIRDNGIGIEPQYFERIFMIFQKLHGEKYTGTGIGLALCKKIIERHGGRIWVESEPGQGSTFYFTIPDGKGR